MGEIQVVLGRRREATDTFQRLVAAGDPKGLVGLARMASNAGRHAEADELLEPAVAAGNLYATETRGRWQWRRDRSPSAEALLRTALDEEPLARGTLGHLLYKTGPIEEVREVLENGLANGDHYCAIPLGHILRQHYKDAPSVEEVYRKGIAVGDVRSHNNLATRLLRRREWVDGVEHLRLGTDKGDRLAAKNLKKNRQKFGCEINRLFELEGATLAQRAYVVRARGRSTLAGG